MVSLLFAGLIGRLDGPVVCFRAAGCKINLIFFRADHTGNLPAGLIHRFLALSRQLIDAGRISVILGKPGKHGLHHFRSAFGCCRVI